MMIDTNSLRQARQRGVLLAAKTFNLSKQLPPEQARLAAQLRRSCRVSCATLAGAGAYREDKAQFLGRLGISFGEAVEAKYWLLYAKERRYLSHEQIQPALLDFDMLFMLMSTVVRRAGM